jgi:hypothetical protein
MPCNPFSQTGSPAVRRYNQGIAFTMGGYLLATFGTTTFVHRHQPQGLSLYALSAIPSCCIFAMLAVVIVYLRDEKDEYQRLLTVRSLLAAAFAILAVGAYVDFLRSFGHLPALAPFTEFVVFWMVFGLAHAVQSFGDRTDE